MTKKIAIIDYGAGNLFSVQAAFARVLPADTEIIITASPTQLQHASHIILPGVGAFADCLQALQACTGMIAALEKEIFTKHKPFLGICVGMQLLSETGYEGGQHQGLGWIKGEVVPLAPDHARQIRIPHMGWNDITIVNPHPLLENIRTGDDMYFVHSYHMVTKEPEIVLATTDYGQPITAIIAKGNIMGTQCHPEKSHLLGASLLANFVKME